MPCRVCHVSRMSSLAMQAHILCARSYARIFATSESGTSPDASIWFAALVRSLPMFVSLSALRSINENRITESARPHSLIDHTCPANYAMLLCAKLPSTNLTSRLHNKLNRSAIPTFRHPNIPPSHHSATLTTPSPSSNKPNCQPTINQNTKKTTTMQDTCQTPTVTFLPVSKTRKPHTYSLAPIGRKLLKNNAKNLFRRVWRPAIWPVGLYPSLPPCAVRPS